MEKPVAFADDLMVSFTNPYNTAMVPATFQITANVQNNDPPKFIYARAYEKQGNNLVLVSTKLLDANSQAIFNLEANKNYYVTLESRDRNDEGTPDDPADDTPAGDYVPHAIISVYTLP